MLQSIMGARELVRLAPMPLRRRIVESVGLAVAADATHGCSALFERQEATVGAAAAALPPILGAPWVGIVWLLIGPGGRRGQRRHQ
jgi:hypothetical protein